MLIQYQVFDKIETSQQLLQMQLILESLLIALIYILQLIAFRWFYIEHAHSE